ncbi:MAG: Rieske 2Fe-2S domain-containing protein [Solirubrobacteraceae bacterium]
MATEQQAGGDTTWEAGRPTRPALHELAERLGEVEALDPVAEKVSDAARQALSSSSALKDAISGTWLGHALHPPFTDLPIGAWTSATLVDLLGGREGRPAADRLIGIGIATALPTAVTGLSDWADSTKLDDTIRRAGAVHAAANVTALALYSASLAARRRGRRGRGVVYGLAGAAAVTVGGYLGGHLSYAKGLGVDQTTFHRHPEDWTRALGEDELGEGEVRDVELEGTPILLTRRDGRVYAMLARCSHRGGPLQDGEIADGCVTCPLHGSRFRLEDGSIVRGPAVSPQPVYDVRLHDGAIEVRLR